MARWLPIGNIHTSALHDIMTGPRMASVTEYLQAQFTPIEMPCVPKMCDPQCGPSCSPACRPKGDCRPVGGCVPDYRPKPCRPR
ncbi:hypothetical protein NE236_19425 [Actinoallomurus purpureus]|uniref:hypothetical protein n=1 Tax=Actinoallomurus purpureus TaxID=478114 RepID=UPI0020922293|nr:hypothetical protein [Actinoallomurus purpureus]MCO6007156.1 hypothetical protein [Actinoallomurus purpureus]